MATANNTQPALRHHVALANLNLKDIAEGFEEVSCLLESISRTDPDDVFMRDKLRDAASTLASKYANDTREIQKALESALKKELDAESAK